MQNKAAWLKEKKAYPFEVDDAPMPTPSNGQILIRNRAIAINPVDWYVQSHGIIFEKFPAVIGEDVAGEVIAIGPDVTTFKVGDRVLGCADSMKGYGAFQLYPIVPEAIAAKIPETVSFAEGAVLPLATQTASYSLFAKSCLGLPYPELKPKETGKTLVIWGAGTSVGSCAVQMARAAGYKVFATASEKNFEYCKGLGAERVFDYNTSTVVEDVLKALENQDPVGVMVAIGVDTAVVGAAQVASQLKGRKPLATVFVSLDQQKMVVPKGIPENVEIFVCPSMNIVEEGIAQAVFGQWLAPALESGLMKCKPDPKVVGEGLEKIQLACDTLKAGISATKVAVELP